MVKNALFLSSHLVNDWDDSSNCCREREREREMGPGLGKIVDVAPASVEAENSLCGAKPMAREREREREFDSAWTSSVLIPMILPHLSFIR